MSSVPWNNETERADWYKTLYNNLLSVSQNLECEVENLKSLLAESKTKILKTSYRDGVRDIVTLLEEMAEKEKIIVIDGNWAISQLMIDKAKMMLVGEG